MDPHKLKTTLKLKNKEDKPPSINSNSRSSPPMTFLLQQLASLPILEWTVLLVWEDLEDLEMMEMDPMEDQEKKILNI